MALRTALSLRKHCSRKPADRFFFCRRNIFCSSVPSVFYPVDSWCLVMIFATLQHEWSWVCLACVFGNVCSAHNLGFWEKQWPCSTKNWACVCSSLAELVWRKIVQSVLHTLKHLLWAMLLLLLIVPGPSIATFMYLLIWFFLLISTYWRLTSSMYEDNAGSCTWKCVFVLEVAARFVLHMAKTPLHCDLFWEPLRARITPTYIRGGKCNYSKNLRFMFLLYFLSKLHLGISWPCSGMRGLGTPIHERSSIGGIQN